MTQETPKPARCHGRMKSVVAVLAVAALATAGLAWAGHSRSQGNGGSFEFGSRIARLHVEFAVDRALRAAEASPEQRDKVSAILDKAFADHERFRDERRSLHAEALSILSADKVDRSRIEALRARHIQIAEEGSHHVATVLADIADVLTPAQRQKLAARAQQMLE